MKIGCGFDPKIYLEDPHYRKLIKTHFDFVIPGWGMTPTHHYKNQRFSVWQPVVDGVEAAISDGLQVHGHFLMSRFSVPDWLGDLADSDHPEGFRLLRSMVKETVGFWGDRISDWIVSNEMIGATGLDPRHPFVRMVGQDALIHAFRAAHEANPRAKLWLKEFGIQSIPQWDAVFKELVKLKAESVPIHGVGAHLHVSLFPRRRKHLIENIAAHLYPYHGVRLNLLRYQINRAKQLGLEFQASEVLVCPGDDSEGKRPILCKTYQRYLKEAYAGKCSHFSLWCPVDDVRYPGLSWNWRQESDFPGLWRWDCSTQGYIPKGDLPLR